jgi:hypothetical protein
MNTQKLEKIHACSGAIEYVKTQKSTVSAWENCPRGDWMLWLASKLNINKRLLTLAKGKCAQTVLHLMKDQRSKDAVKAAIDYGEGNITDQELAAAADAYVAAYAADAAAAYAAAAAAAYAAAAYAAAAYAAAKRDNQLLTANICREILTEAVLTAYKRLKVHR